MDPTYPARQFRPLLLSQSFGAWNLTGSVKEEWANYARKPTRRAGHEISLLDACQMQCTRALPDTLCAT